MSDNHPDPEDREGIDDNVSPFPPMSAKDHNGFTPEHARFSDESQAIYDGITEDLTLREFMEIMNNNDPDTAETNAHMASASMHISLHPGRNGEDRDAVGYGLDVDGKMHLIEHARSKHIWAEIIDDVMEELIRSTSPEAMLMALLGVDPR